MAHHKKHPNRNRRASCKLCKPWKAFHAGKRERQQSKRQLTKIAIEG